MTYPYLAFTRTWVKVMGTAVRQTQILRCAKTQANHLRAFSAPCRILSLESHNLRQLKRLCILHMRPVWEKITKLRVQPIYNPNLSTIQVLISCKSRWMEVLWNNDNNLYTRPVTSFSRQTAAYGRMAQIW